MLESDELDNDKMVPGGRAGPTRVEPIKTGLDRLDAGGPGSPARHHLVVVELVALEHAGGVLGQSGGVVRDVQSLERRAAGKRCAAVVLLLSHPMPPDLARMFSLPA